MVVVVGWWLRPVLGFSLSQAEQKHWIKECELKKDVLKPYQAKTENKYEKKGYKKKELKDME